MYTLSRMMMLSQTRVKGNADALRDSTGQMTTKREDCSRDPKIEKQGPNRLYSDYSAWCGEIVGTIYLDEVGVFQASMPFEYMERMEPQDRTSIIYSFANDVAPFYIHMGMDQYLLIPFLVGWTSIYQLCWSSPGVQGFDTLPYTSLYSCFLEWR